MRNYQTTQNYTKGYKRCQQKDAKRLNQILQNQKPVNSRHCELLQNKTTSKQHSESTSSKKNKNCLVTPSCLVLEAQCLGHLSLKLVQCPAPKLLGGSKGRGVSRGIETSWNTLFINIYHYCNLYIFIYL